MNSHVSNGVIPRLVGELIGKSKDTDPLPGHDAIKRQAERLASCVAYTSLIEEAINQCEDADIPYSDF